jgi:hypothetical protein
MVRLSMKSEEEASEGWQERVCKLGVTIAARPTGVGSTVYLATRGSAELLLEQATGRDVETWIARPSDAQQQLADALIECGATKRQALCHASSRPVRY